ncbi:MAG: extracellular solute-binding protein [Terrimicrobiaceae bacterium]|nr:extracellular solute-binding protein [Terrimicrobiaceae bacterium]
MTGRLLVILAVLAVVVGVPFALKPKRSLLASADDTLVIISPHNEAIRYEFSRAFAAYHFARTGRTVRIDWRSVGGTSEIARYLQGEYYNAFKREWTAAGRPWTSEAAAGYANGSLKPDAPGQAERQAFLASNAGIGIDLFFGGGAFDFIAQAKAGTLVDCGILTAHRDWFTDASIPISVSGEPYYDPAGRWIGTCLSAFGICYNSDSLRRLGVSELPASWNDLTDPKFARQVALADPTKSGSIAKAFEMVIQQQMQQVVGAAPATDAALAAGWTRGLQLLLKASANSRYFADAAPKVPLDVSLGDAAIGMCIDFYGRFQSESVKIGDRPSRLQYFTPLGGSSVGVDPIGMLRGAPHAALAREFIAFVLSIDGQKLWNFQVGAPGGPVRYALRRLPVRKELYAPEFTALRSDPGARPYEEAASFSYHEAWTGPLFSALRFIIRVSCIDSHDEQAAAWQALIAAGFPPAATAAFNDVSAIDYAAAKEGIRPALKGSTPLEEVQLARRLGDHFRTQYHHAEQLAKEGK